MFRDRVSAVVYFADHCDEAYDFKDHVGRAIGLHLLGPTGLQAQLVVPFMIWLSDSWKENYPDDELQIRIHLHEPFVLDVALNRNLGKNGKANKVYIYKK